MFSDQYQHIRGLVGIKPRYYILSRVAVLDMYLIKSYCENKNLTSEATVCAAIHNLQTCSKIGLTIFMLCFSGDRELLEN